MRCATAAITNHGAKKYLTGPTMRCTPPDYGQHGLDSHHYFHALAGRDLAYPSTSSDDLNPAVDGAAL